MAQAVSGHYLTAEAQIRAWVIPCGIYGGQSGAGIGLSPTLSVLSCRYYSTVASYSNMNWEMNSRQAGGCDTETYIVSSRPILDRPVVQSVARHYTD
jgi:hypothetical protein